MSSQGQVRELFSLPKKEVIFDDFGCTYTKGILHQGRMYITENYICFYSSIMGISKKLIIPMNDVTKITKARTLGLMKSLKIYQSGKKKAYTFQSFADIDKTYNIIHKLWVNVSSYAKEEGNSTEEETQSVVDNETIRDNSLVSDINKANDKRNQTVVEKAESNKINLNTSITMNNNQQQLSNSNDLSFTLIEEIKKDDNRGDSFKQSIMTVPIQASLIEQPSQQKRQEQNFDLGVDRATSSQKQPQNGVQVEKAQGYNDIVNNGKSKDKEGAFDNITRDDLEKLLEPYPIPENHEEMEKFCLNMSANDFFTNVMLHSGVYSLEKFYHEHGEQKIQSQEWKIPDPPEEYDGKPVIQSSQLFVEIQVKDNPFVKVSPTTKYFKLVEKTDTKIVVKILSKCTNVPYCDTFGIEEEFLAISPAPNAPMCIVRILAQVLFYKSTIFKSKIQAGSVKGAKAVWIEFADWFKKKNLLFKEKKQGGAGKLKHGIEKSNKLFERANKQNNDQELQPKNFKEKVQKHLQNGRKQIINYRVEFMLFLILLFQLYIFLKLRSLESYMISQHIHDDRL